MNNSGFNKIDIMILLVIMLVCVSIFLPIYAHKRHIQKLEKLYYSQNKITITQIEDYSVFWDTLDRKLRNKFKNVSVEERENYKNSFFKFLDLKISDDNNLIILKEDGTIANPEALTCQLNSFDPNKPFIHSVCPLL